MKERRNEKKEATQQQLSKDGLSEKETESRRNADLIKHKAFNGGGESVCCNRYPQREKSG